VCALLLQIFCSLHSELVSADSEESFPITNYPNLHDCRCLLKTLFSELKIFSYYLKLIKFLENCFYSQQLRSC